MKWKKYTLATSTQAVDLVSWALGEAGIQGIEIEDRVPLEKGDTKGMFIDVLPQLPPDDGIARVSFYLDWNEDEEQVLRQVEEGLDQVAQFTDLGPRTFTVSETEDKDWINNWKQYFKPFALGQMLIKPTWEDVPKEHQDKLLIQIDPGTAFGTGQHETTQLCLRQLPKYVDKGMAVMDVGTGSGILGIAALKLGAGRVFATDLDQQAIGAVAQNLAANQINPKDFQVVQGDLIQDKWVQDLAGCQAYDLVVANILADVIIQLQKEVGIHMKKGGIFITSGIIHTKEGQVLDALKANQAFEVVEVNRQGDWVSVIARKRQ